MECSKWAVFSDPVTNTLLCRRRLFANLVLKCPYKILRKMGAVNYRIGKVENCGGFEVALTRLAHNARATV